MRRFLGGPPSRAFAPSRAPIADRLRAPLKHRPRGPVAGAARRDQDVERVRVTSRQAS
ncbi:hypothetical protein GSH08_23415 [Burkholderia pseudomallei]|nr:hypothetical protein [Burkholderia pseudomallei]MBM5586992.1 hypothetical protein [Burkholderia pseudomallei]RPA08404.1 hypothetical protein EGT86_12745 [Burkholderia pseudomallei]